MFNWVPYGRNWMLLIKFTKIAQKLLLFLSLLTDTTTSHLLRKMKLFIWSHTYKVFRCLSKQAFAGSFCVHRVLYTHISYISFFYWKDRIVQKIWKYIWNVKVCKLWFLGPTLAVSSLFIFGLTFSNETNWNWKYHLHDFWKDPNSIFPHFRNRSS